MVRQNTMVEGHGGAKLLTPGSWWREGKGRKEKRKQKGKGRCSEKKHNFQRFKGTPQ
jgi:hypothetical protein